MNTHTETQTGTGTQTGTQTGTGTDLAGGGQVGVGVVFEGVGLVGGGVTVIDPASPDPAVGVGGGPFVTIAINTDNDNSAGTTGGGLVGVVGVVDGEGVDTVVDTLGSGVAGVVGGRVGVVSGAGTVGEIGLLFEGPVEVGVWQNADGVIKAVMVTPCERRQEQPLSGPSRGSVVGGLDKLVNVALDVSVELGRTKVTLADVLDYDVGSVVELDRAAGAPVDIRVNDTLLAQGEVVLIDDEYAVRITAIIEPHQ